MTEGLKKNESYVVKYFNLITLLKKIFFMFALVCLYDAPVYQIGVICISYSSLLILYILYNPLQEREEYIKCVSCEALIF